MIKVTVGEQKTQSEKPFPKLMISYKHKSIILATSKSGNFIKGTLLSAGSSVDEFGEYFDQWSALKFTDFNEPITLQNA
jgi:hypothetical protein